MITKYQKCCRWERRKLDSYGNYEDRFRYKDISDKFDNMKKHTEVRK